MRTGFIKWFDPKLNYGFIRAMNESGDWSEFFVHGSDINFNVRDGDFVSFSIRDGWKGPKAVCVKKRKAGVLN
jgi:CspA family cold shock protein